MDLITSLLVHNRLKNHPMLVDTVFMLLLHGIQIRVLCRMGLLKVRRLIYFFPKPRGQRHHQQRSKSRSLAVSTGCFAMATPPSHMLSLRLIDQHIQVVYFLATCARWLGPQSLPPAFAFPRQPPKAGGRASPRIPPASPGCGEAFAMLPSKLLNLPLTPSGSWA